MNKNHSKQPNAVQQPLRLQQIGGAFQAEVISDPSVKQSLFGWLSSQELGPESQFRFSAQLDSKKLGVLRHAQMMLAKRPGNARSGYLCFYPPLKVAIFVEDSDHRRDQEIVRPPRTMILRMRHSPSIYNSGGSVFAATLNVSDSTLWIEDVLTLQGQKLWTTHAFSKRWQTLKTWFETDWSEDPNLQRGLIIKPRQPTPLTSFSSEPGDVWEFIPEDAGRRRLMWKDKRLSTVVIPSYPQKEQPRKQKRFQENNQGTKKPENSIKVADQVPQQAVQVGILDTYFPSLPNEGDGSLIAVAKKETGPDVYSLYTAESAPLGIAVIRKMAISLAMRTYCKETPTRVRVEWCPSFERWEILDVNVNRTTSSSTAFNNKTKA
jgi:hypothetical protein